MPAEALAAAYLAARPQAAARVLEQADPAHAAVVLARAGAGDAAGTLAHMLPAAAAACLRALDTSFAAEVLRELTPRTTLCMLHALAPDARAQMLGALPRAPRAHLAAVLDYAPGSVGALMEPPRAVLPAGVRVDEAIARIARIGAPHPFEVYVVDTAQRPLGALRPGALLGAAASERVERLMSPVDVALPAHAPASAVRTHPAWLEHPALPVVDEHEALAGVLSYQAVCVATRGGNHAQATGADAVDNALAAAGALWTALADTVTRTLGPPREPDEATPEVPRD